MRRFMVVDPQIDGTPSRLFFTEEDIITNYYAWWSEEMAKRGKAHLVSPKRCIEDWVVINWAEEIFE